jgi:hypothetical protein
VLKTAAIIEFSQSFLVRWPLLRVFLFGAVVYLMKGMLSGEGERENPLGRGLKAAQSDPLLAGKKFRFLIWLHREREKPTTK